MGSNVSRRNFIRIVTDALITLPPAAALLPAAALPAGATLAASPTEALAATGDDTGILGVRGPVAEDGVLWTNEVKLIPLNTSEVAFHVVDMAIKNPEANFVPGAHVKVTSRDNGKSVEGYTNENGDVLFNIATLAENPDNLPIDKLEKYFFFGTVEVTCEGYRDFLTGRMIVEGMETHVVPTRKLEDDMPYPAKVTFDAWDILYSDNTPMYNATNTTKHALEVLIKNVGDESVTIALCERKSKQVVRSFEDFPIDGAISGAFHYEFLHKGSNEAISPETSYCITITREDGTAYEFPIALWAEETAFSEPKTVPKTDNLAPLGTKPGFQAGLSKIIPIGGGDTFKSWLPTFGPFEVSFDPGGSASVSLLIGKEDWNGWGKSKEWAERPDGSMGYEEKDYGAKPSSKDGWQWFPKKSIDDQWAKKKQDIQDSYKSFKAAQAVRKGANKKDIMYSHGFHMGVTLTAQGIFTWEGLKYTGSSLFEKGTGGLAWNAKNSAKFSGALGIAILASADYEFCRNFFWGPVPMLFQFGINLKVNASALGGMVIDDPDTDRLEKVKRGEPVTDKWDIVTNFDNWNYDFTNTGFNLTVTFSPYISLGVGIKGVASASVRGSVLLTVYMGIPTRRKSLHDGQPDISDTNAYPAPHWIFSYQAEISVQLELFFFSYAISVAKGKKTNAYNNWPCKENGFKPGGGWADGPFLEAAADDEVAFDSYANRDLASLINDMQPMDGNFSRMVEGSWTPSLTAQAEEEPPTVYCKYQEDAMVADDGTQIPCTMYSYFPLEEAQSAQDLSELEKQVEEAKAAAEQKAKDAEEAQTKADEARAQAADAQSREDEASLLNAESAAAEAAAAEAAQAEAEAAAQA
ncbi:MAG: hypothetical protein IKG21_01410, partial [Atopobiaceae bacterium]|nr:hypothetical protein [Atopobiaceae bacterium]